MTAALVAVAAARAALLAACLAAIAGHLGSGPRVTTVVGSRLPACTAIVGSMRRPMSGPPMGAMRLHRMVPMIVVPIEALANDETTHRAEHGGGYPSVTMAQMGPDQSAHRGPDHPAGSQGVAIVMPGPVMMMARTHSMVVTMARVRAVMMPRPLVREVMAPLHTSGEKDPSVPIMGVHWTVEMPVH